MVGSHLRPVGIQLPRVWVEKDEAGLIAHWGGKFTELGDQRTGQTVVRQHIQSSAEDERRRGDLIEKFQQAQSRRVNRLRAGAPFALHC